jgi:hypothetical protein
VHARRVAAGLTLHVPPDSARTDLLPIRPDLILKGELLVKIDPPEPCIFAADVDPPDAPATAAAWVAWIFGLLVVVAGLAASLAVGWIIGLSLR